MGKKKNKKKNNHIVIHTTARSHFYRPSIPNNNALYIPLSNAPVTQFRIDNRLTPVELTFGDVHDQYRHEHIEMEAWDDCYPQWEEEDDGQWFP